MNVLRNRLYTVQTPGPTTPATGSDREDERLLIEQAQAGHGAAFDELNRRYINKAYSIAYQMLSDPDNARDLVQDAFMEVFRTLNRFNTQYRFSTWLYRILINKCINFRKRETRRRLMSIPEFWSGREQEGHTVPAFTLAATTVTPHEILEHKELTRAIRDALNSLSERHRTVVVLFDLEGLSHKQIAEILQCPEGTVMSRLHHGRLKLKHILSRRLKGYFPR